MFQQSFFILGFALAFVSCLRLPKTYEFVLVSFSSRPDDNRILFDISNINIKGRERAANGTINVPVDLDDTYELYVHSFSDPLGSGNFKQLPMIIPKTPICKALKDYFKKYTYPSLIPGVNTDFPFDGSKCPIPKGTYYIKNMQLDPRNFPDFLPRGYGKGIVYFVKGDQKMGESEFVIQVVDRVF